MNSKKSTMSKVPPRLCEVSIFVPRDCDSCCFRLLLYVSHIPIIKTFPIQIRQHFSYKCGQCFISISRDHVDGAGGGGRLGMNGIDSRCCAAAVTQITFLGDELSWRSALGRSQWDPQTVVMDCRVVPIRRCVVVVS